MYLRSSGTEVKTFPVDQLKWWLDGKILFFFWLCDDGLSGCFFCLFIYGIFWYSNGHSLIFSDQLSTPMKRSKMSVLEYSWYSFLVLLRLYTSRSQSWTVKTAGLQVHRHIQSQFLLTHYFHSTQPTTFANLKLIHVYSAGVPHIIDILQL